MDIARASQALLCGLADAEYCPGLTVRDPASDFSGASRRKRPFSQAVFNKRSVFFI